MQGVAARICFLGAVKGGSHPKTNSLAEEGGGRTRAELKPRPTAKKADAPRGAAGGAAGLRKGRRGARTAGDGGNF